MAPGRVVFVAVQGTTYNSTVGMLIYHTDRWYVQYSAVDNVCAINIEPILRGRLYHTVSGTSVSESARCLVPLCCDSHSHAPPPPLPGYGGKQGG